MCDVTSVLAGTAKILLMVKKVKLLTPNVNYSVLLSVPVSKRQWSLLSYRHCLYQYGGEIFPGCAITDFGDVTCQAV